MPGDTAVMLTAMPVTMSPIAVSAHTVTSVLGRGRDQHVQALADMVGGLRANDFTHAALDCWIGRVADIEDNPLPPKHAYWDCRNNRLAWLGLVGDDFLVQAQAAVARHGASRVAVLCGTSTGSIGLSESGYRQLTADNRLPPGQRDGAQHSLHSLAMFTAHAVGATGPCLTSSTACSSSARVFAMAARLLQLGLVDAAIVGGVDSLCDSVLFGFNALELVAPTPCRPFDAARQGISIGEAAGFALLERPENAPAAPRLVGYGESSDAWHMSTPHPEGRGAQQAVDAALARAGLAPQHIDYINLHGTASHYNDSVEGAVIARTFDTQTRVSSTKGFTGHTLGAAGITGATVCLLAMEHGLVPGNLGCTAPDTEAADHLALTSSSRPVSTTLCNALGFGGNNVSLVFRHAGAAA